MCLELRPQRRGIKEETDLDACVYIYIYRYCLSGMIYVGKI